MKWFPVMVMGALCLAGGWLLGRLRWEKDEPTPYEVRGSAEPRPALIRRAQLLWEADANRCNGHQVLRFMVHLAESLDDESWRAVSAASAHALEEQRTVEALQDGVLLANHAVIPRFAKSACVEELAVQIRRANAGGFDAGQINALLAKIVEVPIPSRGYSSSPQEALVRASIRAGDLPRAEDYLSKFIRPGEAHPDQVREEQVVLEVVRIGLDAGRGKIDPVRVVGAWNAQANDANGRGLLQPILENAVLSAATELDRKPVIPSLDRLLSGSISAEGAEGFWARILQRQLRRLVRGSDLAIVETADLVKLFASSFGRTEFPYSYWIRAAEETTKSNGGDARRVADFFLRAAAVAVTEPARVSALREAAIHSQRGGDPEKGLQATTGALTAVQDPELRKELSELRAGLETAVRKAQAGASQARRAELERRDRVARRMREVLLRARSDGRSVEDLRAMQEVLKELEDAARE